MASFTLQPLCSQGKVPDTHWMSPEASLDAVERADPLPSLTVELRFLGRPVCSVAITPPDLIENRIVLLIVGRSSIRPNVRRLPCFLLAKVNLTR